MSVADYLAGLPPFAGRRAAEFRLTPLPGLTNRSFRVEVAGERYVLRCPGPGAARCVDRGAEIHNAGLAAGLGVAPALLWHDADGTALFQHVDDARALTPSDLSVPATLERTVDLLRRLHASGVAFAGRLLPVVSFDRYLAIASPSYRRRLAPLREALAHEHPGERRRECPLHVDPTPANFLRDASRLWLTDWEYSGVGDPLWDLACLAGEADLDEAAGARMLTRYFGDDGQAAGAALAFWKRRVAIVGLAWFAAEIAAREDDAGYVAAFERRWAALMARPQGTG